jgi:hypothetical protein
MLLVGLGASASAASPIGKDGQIHACYRVKGKSKGSLRVVRSAKVRCRRGERKVAWNVAGSAGQTGANGQQGQSGANGSPGSEAALQAKVASLSLKVESLEGVLHGVTNGELTGVLSTLNGITNSELTGALSKLSGVSGVELTKSVEALPAVESLCTQASQLTTGVNSLNTGIKGISVLGLGGLSLDTSGLPTLLGAYTCP